VGPLDLGVLILGKKLNNILTKRGILCYNYYMKRIIVANWKMNPQTAKEAEVLLRDLSIKYKKSKNEMVVICPSFLHLYIFKKFKNKKVLLGAQDVSIDNEGLNTGQVSPKMLKDLGVGFVIVGHSERRKMNEGDEVINKKILNLLKNKMTPILCVGEKKRDHDGFYLSYVREQIKSCLEGVSGSNIKNIIIAYEPVWAIGERAERQATVAEFTEIKIFIKKTLSDLYNPKIAHSVSIIYGGSVNSLNAKSFMEEGGSDGLLIGRDSLNYKKFEAILKVVN